MRHRYVSVLLLSPLVAVASVGCGGRTNSLTAPSSIQATAGSAILASPAVHTAAGSRSAKVIATSVQVPFAATVFADWTSEWVELSGNIHVVSHATPLPICQSGEPCLSVSLHTNLDGIKGVGLTTGDRYSLRLVESHLSHVDLEIKDLINEIYQVRLRENAVKDGVQGSQDYELRITANLNKAADMIDTLLCVVSFSCGE